MLAISLRVLCRYVQSFTSQYRQSFHVAICLTIACSRYIYNDVILHAQPVRGESHNQRNATGEVATLPTITLSQTTVLFQLFHILQPQASLF